MGRIPSAVGLDRSAGTIVPVRGVWVSELRHRGWPGWEPGHYDSGVGLKQAFPIRDTVPVVAVAPPGQPNGVSRR